jgi:hypothetical protein
MINDQRLIQSQLIAERPILSGNKAFLMDSRLLRYFNALPDEMAFSAKSWFVF